VAGRSGVSDPFAVVTLLAASSGGGAPRVLGRTEVVYDSLSPDWVKTFAFEYDLGRQQHIVVTLYDEKKEGVERLDKHKKMGQVKFEIGEILGTRGNIRSASMEKGGVVYASAEKRVLKDAGTLSLKLRGKKLANVEHTLFGKSDPFFTVSAQTSPNGDNWDVVYRSEHLDSDLNPVWKEARINVDALCRGDREKPIRIGVYDYSKKGKFLSMGEFETSLAGLLETKSFQLEKGKIEVTGATVEGGDGLAGSVAKMQIADPSAGPNGPPTFVDYLSGGCELNLTVAIDFTGSNGDPRRPGTLHHVDPNALNGYESAIASIVPILANYDSDKKFPVYGFGAKLGGVVRHCFQVGRDPEAFGVAGVMDAYNSVFKVPMALSGPTVFTEVIQTAAMKAAGAQAQAAQSGRQVYSVLLILTDGSVSDTEATKRSIAAVSNEPLSIVIIGVGNADFSAMQYLDDSTLGRDIVQFVPLVAHAHSPPSLAAATLDEIPKQLVQFFQQQGIQPMSKIQIEEEEIILQPYLEEEEIDLTLDLGNDDEIVMGGGGYYDNGYKK